MQTNPTPKKMLERMDKDPFYKFCALGGYHGHTCSGRITREHAIIFGAKRLNEYWAIIPICAKAHAVDAFQDAGTMNKELNRWVALNRATDEELRAISKVPPGYLFERQRLNIKYGVWKAPLVVIYKKPETIRGIKFDRLVIDESSDGVKITGWNIIDGLDFK